MKNEEVVKVLEEILDGNYTIKTDKEDKDKALTTAIETLKLLDKVESGGVEKRSEEYKSNRPYDYIENRGFNEAIDLCNAQRVVELMQQGSGGAEKISKEREVMSGGELRKQIEEMLRTTPIAGNFDRTRAIYPNRALIDGIIDLCNAHFAGKMKGMEAILKDYIVDEKDGHHSVKAGLLETLTQHLTEK